MDKFDKLYLDIAKTLACMSHSTRAKVGALIVKDRCIIAEGWNGTPSGWNNTCEDENNVTLPEVIHAECNAILKCARLGNSVEGATLYVTLSPCFECSKMIVQSGIKSVYYFEEYRDTKPLLFLRKNNISVNTI
jgi:dCMP deaminase